VDPRSGEPLTSPAMAVVVAASATDAEAFSKAVLIRGAAAFPRHWAERGTRGSMSGALLVRPDGIRRGGRIAFVPEVAPRRIAAAAEPLR
jgi:thiamine biosynthesis lipoprotein ApbE